MSKLQQLEQRIREKIQQAKDEMFPGHNRIYLEALRIEIDTLDWVLNEISQEIKSSHPEK
jgi:predicted  nucleic acid-binding Zn-ribbon protein